MRNPSGAAAILRAGRFEALVGALACVVFLSCLGAIEFWGKREQRLAAEVLDTVDHGRWLIAHIQGRPRLEKPPLPRWTTATLATAAGRCDEWIIRLPGALAALGTIALVYKLGRRMGGRSLGLCAAMVLASSPLFITELRQAGNDGPLAFFTTLALYAAYRWLEPRGPADAPRRLAILFHAAMGLGFLCKGPMVLAVVAVALVPATLATGRFQRSLRLWADPWGLPLFLALALCWPVPVLLADPNALGIWMLEMGQKTGASGIAHRERSLFLLNWPVMVLPWVVVGLGGALPPFRRSERESTAAFARWFAWSWAIGSALMLGAWAVAKPNYYVPSLPGWSLLVGAAWVRLHRLARRSAGGRASRWTIRLQWGVWLALGVSTLIIPGRWLPATAATWGAMIASAVALMSAAVVGGRISRRGGAAAAAMLPALVATALVVPLCYGIAGPGQNAARGHRDLARRIDGAVPPEIKTVAFLHELDEGIWLHLRARRLVPVPGVQPQYNDAADLRLQPDGPAERLVPRAKKALADWISRDDRPSDFLLMREKVHKVLADDLKNAAAIVLQAPRAQRDGLVLLRIH